MLIVEDADGSETKYILASAVKTYINAGLTVYQGFLVGLKMSNDTDTAHDINVTSGRATDTTISAYLVLASEMTKQIDNAWVAGDDNGGMFTGSVANSTWYHVFLIEKDSDASIDIGFDTDIDATNIPGGYTKYRRIGSVRTDGSANILQFIQTGDEFLWVVSILDLQDTNFDQGTEYATLSTPVDVSCVSMLNAAASGASSTMIIKLFYPSQNEPVIGCMSTDDTSGALSTRTYVTVRTDTSSRILRDTNRENTSITLETLGYIDRRGQDD
jgi:hypothetical protein